MHTPPLEIFLALAKGERPEAWFYAEVAAHSRRVKGTVAEAWTAAADRAAREFNLSEGERLELMRAGEVFGRFDLDGTIAQLSAAAERFGELAAAAAAKAARMARLFTMRRVDEYVLFSGEHMDDRFDFQSCGGRADGGFIESGVVKVTDDQALIMTLVGLVKRLCL